MPGPAGFGDIILMLGYLGSGAAVAQPPSAGSTGAVAPKSNKYAPDCWRLRVWCNAAGSVLVSSCKGS